MIDIVAVGLDIDEDWDRAAIADRVGRRNERVADGDHLITGADPDRPERQMKRRRAVRDSTRVRSSDQRGELAFECRDLRPLRDPAGQDYAPDGLNFTLVQDWLCDGYLGERLVHAASPAATKRSLRHHATRSRNPSSSDI